MRFREVEALGEAEHTEHPAPRRRSLFDPIGRIVDTVVPTVAGAVDVDDVVRRIDVDESSAGSTSTPLSDASTSVRYWIGSPWMRS